MAKVYYSDRFKKQAKKLTEKQQDKLARLVVLLKGNPFSSQLKTKPLAGKFIGIYSFRLEHDFRALFKFMSPGEILLFNVGHRKDIYR